MASDSKEASGSRVGLAFNSSFNSSPGTLLAVASSFTPCFDRYLSHSIKETLNTKGQVDQSLNCSSLHATLILHSEYSGNLKLEVVRSNIHA